MMVIIHHFIFKVEVTLIWIHKVQDGVIQINQDLKYQQIVKEDRSLPLKKITSPAKKWKFTSLKESDLNKQFHFHKHI